MMPPTSANETDWNSFAALCSTETSISFLVLV